MGEVPHEEVLHRVLGTAGLPIEKQVEEVQDARHPADRERRVRRRDGGSARRRPAARARDARAAPELAEAACAARVEGARIERSDEFAAEQRTVAADLVARV